MRITYLHQYFNTPAMAGSTRSYEMGRRLVGMGHEINIVTSLREFRDSRRMFKTIEDGMIVYWIPVQYSNYMNFIQRIFSFFKFAYEAFKVAVSIQTDIVFASSTPLTIALPGVFSSKWLKVPFVFEVRDLWPEIPIAVGVLKHPVLKLAAHLLERFAYRNSSAIVALSQGMKEGIVKRGYPDDDIVVIPNGSDLDKFDPKKRNREAVRSKYNIHKDAIVILYPGTFGKINGVGYLVKLASKFLDDPRVFFLTVGNGLEFDQIREQALNEGCLDVNMRMLDKVSKLEVARLFDAADIVISTIIPLKELEANSANKFFDGLAAGCCVVVNHQGWQAEILESKGCGFSLSQNIDAAAAQLSKWLDEPRSIHEAGQRGRWVAESDFDRNLLAKKLERLFVSVFESAREIL